MAEMGFHRNGLLEECHWREILARLFIGCQTIVVSPFISITFYISFIFISKTVFITLSLVTTVSTH